MSRPGLWIVIVVTILGERGSQAQPEPKRPSSLFFLKKSKINTMIFLRKAISTGSAVWPYLGAYMRVFYKHDQVDR